MEKWDLYDKNRNKLNKIVNRGDRLNDDEYHLVVNGWIINDNKEFLITQRAPNKSFPYMWECTGGSAEAGEDSLTAVAREIKEELGLDIDKTTGKLFGTKLRHYDGCPDILDVWVFKDNSPISQITVQESEVMNVKWASIPELKKMHQDKQFESNAFFFEILDFYENN